MKRTVTGFLLLVFVFCLSVLPAFAAGPGNPSNKEKGCFFYEYSFDNCSTGDARVFGYRRCETGVKGQAYVFSGRDYLEIPQRLGEDFTITLWIKTKAHSLTGSQCYEGNGLVWSDVAFVHNDYILSLLNDKACFFTGNPDMSVLSKSAVTDGRWHFIAVTRRMKSGQVDLYVDGKKEGQMYSSRSALRDQRVIVLGANTIDNRYYLGAMDEVRLYTCALSPKQVLELYKSYQIPSSRAAGLFGSAAKNPFIFQGTIYYIPEGTSRLPDFRKLRPAGRIYNAVLAIRPQDFDKGFPGITNRFEWFAIDYKGQIFIPRAGTYTFSLLSDDGSRLLIDNRTVIDNDGIHPPREKTGKVFLKRGLHSMEVQYFQGPRYQVALVLSLVKNGRKVPLDIRQFAPIKMKESRCQARLTMGSGILFDFNSYGLKPEALRVLDSVLDLLKDYRYQEIVVEGHTDNVGSDAYNNRLSRQRAQSVANYLIAKGIPQAVIKVVGYGKARPVVPNDTEAHRARNRRVEIVVNRPCRN
ncbi:MAG: hypothetical protein DSZ23_04230 [Thermodesulfatator sp.]|nr:MAG: hypothetical protein DSZ23_04230 [Thermodesulfatator sp.]